ncbi:KH domain-containing protein [Candidatus Microgenomates bacterium]|nr:MAG: KH domain-containing protein [Candidatus Microgenomates bacterium]
MVKTIKAISEEEIIKETIDELLKLLEIEGTFESKLIKNESSEEVDVLLETKDSGIVIGYHGEVLESLQFVLSLAVSKKLERFVRVSIEVGDYKKNRMEFLESLARQTKEKVLEENTEIPLNNLKSWERRVVHLILQDDKEVQTESIGEGKDRVLVVKPR